MTVNLAKGDGHEAGRIIQLAGHNPSHDPRIGLLAEFGLSDVQFREGVSAAECAE
jgi:hypothetical protein